MKTNNKKLTSFIFIIGIILVITSIVLVMFYFSIQNISENKRRDAINGIRELIPEINNSVLENKKNKDTAFVSINDIDFCGIIEVPSTKSELPIYGYWDKKKLPDYPCRFSGSIYNSDLIIGSSDRKGVFDFSDKLNIGDDILITDVTGNRYTYLISDIKSSKSISKDHLSKLNFDFLIFIKNELSFDYTIILCEFK